MLLYELITLKHPFEGQEQVKDIVLNGGRPLIKTKDLIYPTLMLDLMCLCWQDNPRERPSSSDILKYVKSFEFSHLIDVTVLDDYEQSPLYVTTLNQYDCDEDDDENDEGDCLLRAAADDNQGGREDDEEEIEEDDLIDLWLVRNSLEENTSQLEILTYQMKLNCTSRKIVNVSSENIQSICVYNANQIWLVDARKFIYVYW
jgi:hypothetical protein